MKYNTIGYIKKLIKDIPDEKELVIVCPDKPGLVLIPNYLREWIECVTLSCVQHKSEQKETK